MVASNRASFYFYNTLDEVDRLGSLDVWTGIDPHCELPLSARTALRVGSYGIELRDLADRYYRFFAIGR